MKTLLKKILANLIFAFTSAVFWGRVIKPKKQRGALPELSNCRSILVVKLDAIGDLVLTTPFLQALREMAPQAHITLVVKSIARDLMDVCPFVDDVQIFDVDVPNLMKGSSTLAWSWPRWGAYKFGRKLSRNRYFDLAIVPRFDTDEVAAAWLVGGARPRFSLSHCETATSAKALVNRGYDNFYDLAFKSKKTIAHEVERNLELLDALSPEPVVRHTMKLWFTETDKDFVDSWWEEKKLKEFDYVVALVPGARSPKREWGETNYAQLISRLIENPRIAIIVMGGPQEREIGESLSRISERVFNAAGLFTLRQSFCALLRCTLYVGSDTGSMHLAVAASVPIIEISCQPLNGDPSSYNSPVRFGPWLVPFQAIQPQRALNPCSEMCEFETPHCITQISVDAVQTAITEFWPEVEKRRSELLSGSLES